MYLSVIRDVFDGYIVAYKYSTHIDSKLVADTLKPAYKNNKIDGTILHSDQGSTYTTLLYYNLTKKIWDNTKYVEKGNTTRQCTSRKFLFSI